jgi:hypothetical protein
MRSVQMIEDIEKYRGTLLVWSAMGGGSISLPYLEHEAYGEVDPRMRFYGFMNDSEFAKECGKRGIKVFGIVFEVQGWEFPAAIGRDKNGNTVMQRFNVEHGGECGDWYGLREFSQDRHWELFGKKFSDYYPDGLYNSAGEEVTDLWYECCAKTYKGEPVHSDWVEVKNHRQIAYQMCRNNPVWRDYLKKIIKIMIDAGLQGIQLDECELPMTSIGAGGCFCRDCMNGFRDYLKRLKSAGKLCEALMDEDLERFDYAGYLLKNNLDYPRYYEDVPLYKYYWDYQLRQIKKYFKELADYIKDYGREQGREVLVSGNFFTLMPSYFPLAPYADVIITEMKNTLFRQPAWYRYAAGFAGKKPVIVAENPYGGVIPELLEKLNRGRGFDLYRIFLLEAAAYGCNMSVPYGGWMGNTIKDAFYPPEKVTMEVQNFIADKEHLFSKDSGADAAILYSYPSYYWREAVAGYSQNIVTNGDIDLLAYSNADMDSPNSSRLPFWEASRCMSGLQVCYDVVLCADGELREDDFSFADIEDYPVLVLPDCHVITERQAGAIEQFAAKGKTVILWGRYAENLPGAKEKLLKYESVRPCANHADKTSAIKAFAGCFNENYRPLVKISEPSLGVHTHKTGENKLAVHLINYHYDHAADAVHDIDVEMEIRRPVHSAVLHTLTGDAEKIPADRLKIKDGKSCIQLISLPLYAVVEIEY